MRLEPADFWNSQKQEVLLMRRDLKNSALDTEQKNSKKARHLLKHKRFQEIRLGTLR